jgi:hypothetical protein
MAMRLPLHRSQVCALIAGVLLASVAAGGSATASRAEIERWFVTLHAERSIDLAVPQRWEYSFAAADGRALEALSVALVRDGYQIVALAARDAPTLRMAKAEVHSPLTLAQRNQALQQTAHKFHARYIGVDVARGD